MSEVDLYRTTGYGPLKSTRDLTTRNLTTGASFLLLCAHGRLCSRRFKEFEVACGSVHPVWVSGLEFRVSGFGFRI